MPYARSLAAASRRVVVAFCAAIALLDSAAAFSNRPFPLQAVRRHAGPLGARDGTNTSDRPDTLSLPSEAL